MSSETSSREDKAAGKRQARGLALASFQRLHSTEIATTSDH